MQNMERIRKAVSPEEIESTREALQSMRRMATAEEVS